VERKTQQAVPKPLPLNDPWLHIAERASSGYLWEWDVQSGSIQCSDVCREYYSFPPSATFDHATWHQRIHPDDRSAFHSALAEAHLARQPILRREFRSVSDAGNTRWVCSHAEIIYDQAGDPVRMCGIDIDVTPQRRALESLKRSEKLVLAGQIAATVAHEINNPLEAVGNLVYLANLESSAEKMHAYLTNAEEELARIQGIARQTLGFYRDDPIPRMLMLAEVMQLTVRVLERRAQQKQVRIQLSLDPQTRICANRGELLQVLINLVANAIDAVSTGGLVQVRADALNGRVRIAVLDNGSGIPSQHRPCIFQPFFTSKGQEGTGLGLWVSRSIAERHGGSIRYRSSTLPGRSGTIFIVSLPDLQLKSNAA
jgi:signal transduction histidine kinase